MSVEKQVSLLTTHVKVKQLTALRHYVLQHLEVVTTFYLC